jgi:glycosyltransferase involved in cell wall biosynthesis
MRVLWLSHLLPYPAKGGVQQRSFNLLRQVSNRHEVLFTGLYQAAHQAAAQDLEEGRNALAQFCSVGELLPLPVDARRHGKARQAVSSLLTGGTYNVDWLRSAPAAAALERAVARFQPDVMHFDTVGLAQYRRLPRVADVPAALNHHNVESHMLLRRAQNAANPALGAYFRVEGRRLERYERRVGADFHMHFACSSNDRDRLGELLPGVRIEVVPNGVDLDYFVPAANPSRIARRLVFAGRLSWYPNDSAMRMFLKDVWPLLIARMPDVSITIIGKGASAPLAAAAAGDTRIALPGFVPDVRPYIDEAQIYVCPIFDGGGTKLKILDALAMGAAIIAHPIACEGIDVTAGENVLFASTPQEFRDSIVRLLEDPQLAARLRRNARKLAEERYSFVHIGANLASLLDQTARSAAGKKKTRA